MQACDITEEYNVIINNSLCTPFFWWLYIYTIQLNILL